MKMKLWSLTLGNFAIGTGAMIVSGMLNQLTADLAVTPAAIGVIISAFAITVCVGGPLLAGVTSGIERRKLLTGCLVLYAVSHLLASQAPGYGSLLLMRIVTAIGAGLFTAQAAATASLMVPPSQRGNAISLVFLGWSISAVLGMPLGSWLGAHIGWRPTMALVGLMAAVFAAGVWTQIPARLFVATVDRLAWKSLFGNRALVLAIAVTAVQAAGQFTAFSYMALMLKDFINASPEFISLVFACFGLAGLTGNVIAMRFMDRIGAARVALIGMSCMVLGLGLWPLTRASPTMTVALAILWGLGIFSVNGSQQVRLIGLAPQLASASVALNSSAMYLGQAFGALAGGTIIATHGSAWLTPAGLVLVLCAIALSQYALGLARRVSNGKLA